MVAGNPQFNFLRSRFLTLPSQAVDQAQSARIGPAWCTLELRLAEPYEAVGQHQICRPSSVKCVCSLTLIRRFASSSRRVR